MASICVIFIALFIFTYALWLYFGKERKRYVELVDQFHNGRTWPFLGNIAHGCVDSKDFLEQLLGFSFVYNGDLKAFRFWCIQWAYIVVHGADEAKDVLTNNAFIDKSREYRPLRPFLGLGLLTSGGTKWRTRRKLLTPTFHYHILKDFVYVFNKQAKVLVCKLAKRADTGPFDVYQYMTLCALDIICETSMGRDVNAQHDKDALYVKAIYALNDMIHYRQKQPWFWPDWLFYLFGKGKLHDECLRIVHGFTEKVIKERYEALSKIENIDENANGDEGRKRLTFMDLLIKMVQEGQLTLGDVREEVDTFMFEGHDTTSAGMNWALYLIGANPHVQAKIHQEVDALYGDEDRDVHYDDLKNLAYLECCLKETLRLFPSVPIFGRVIKEDAYIGGRLAPRGTQVLVNAFAVHRDPTHWPDPELYIPERFLPENCIGRHAYAYIPFSAGARNCIGQRFALMEEKTVLAWIFRYFSIKSVHRRDQLRATPELILRPLRGVHIELQLRRPLNIDIYAEQ